jgi:two-component system sensor histidine kinase KdpD
MMEAMPPSPATAPEPEPAQPSPGRLLVALSPSAFSERLIALARDRARERGLPWSAVYVSQGGELAPAQRSQLKRNLDLAAAAGAEVLNLQGADIGAALLKAGKDLGAVEWVIGAEHGGWASALRDRVGLRRLGRQDGVGLHVIGRAERGAARAWPFQTSLVPYWYALWVLAAMAGLGFLVEPLAGYHAVGLFFLCALLVQSLFFPLGPLVLGALLSALAWDYFFIPPRFQWRIQSPDDLFMIAAFFLAAVTTGLLTGRLRRDQRIAEVRQRRSDLLSRLAQVLLLGQGRKPLREVADMLQAALRREFTVHVAGPDGSLDGGQLWHRDLKPAAWALEHRQACGWGTRQFPQADALYVPLLGQREAVGLLLCRPMGQPPFTIEEEELLRVACGQLALWLEHGRMEARAQEAGRLQLSEQLHQTLLNSLSHEMRTPLTALLGTAAAIQDLDGDAERTGLYKDLAAAGERLNRVVDNLLDMARLSSGVLTLKLEWQDPAELMHLTVGRLKGPLGRHRIAFGLPPEPPLVRMDYRLMEHALSNLLLNAAAYSPEGGDIRVGLEAAEGRLCFRVSDQGPGIPDDSLPRIFDKFYRVPGSPAGGLGLGLNIVQSLVQAHGGTASARNLAGGGAEFTLCLPLDPAPEVPLEAAS